MDSSEDDVYNMCKKDFETDIQYNFRKSIYEEIYKDTNDKKKSLIYSNIWVNILSMSCEYPKEIMKAIEKYRPKTNIYSGNI